MVPMVVVSILNFRSDHTKMIYRIFERKSYHYQYM